MVGSPAHLPLLTCTPSCTQSSSSPHSSQSKRWPLSCLPLIGKKALSAAPYLLIYWLYSMAVGSDQGSNLCPCSGSSVSAITSSNPSSLCSGFHGPPVCPTSTASVFQPQGLGVHSRPRSLYISFSLSSRVLPMHHLPRGSQFFSSHFSRVPACSILISLHVTSSRLSLPVVSSVG